MLLGAVKDVVLTDQMMRMIFMVPVIAEEERVRELWRMNAVELKKDGKLYRVQAHHSYVAIGGGAMIPLTATQMMSCQIVYGVRICTDVRIAERRAMSCITALYTGDEAATNKLCKFELVELGEQGHATALGSTYFYLRAEVPLREKCGDSHRSREFTGEQVGFVSGQCQLTGAGFDILRLPAPSGQETYKPQISFDFKRADSVMEDVDAKVMSEVKALEERLPKVHKLAQVGDSTWIWVLVGLAVAGVVLGFVGAWLLKHASRILARICAKAAGNTDGKALTYKDNTDGHKKSVVNDMPDVLKEGQAPAEVPPRVRAQGLVEEGENVAARVLPSILEAMAMV